MEPHGRLAVAQPRAGLDIQYLSPVPLKFRQWDGFDPPPRREFPNQWHVESSTQDKRQQVGMLTVLVPYRSGKRPDWTAQRIESGETIGVCLSLAGRRTTVRFPQPDRPGPLRIQRE